tara:strand:- start:1223 stop:1615 length:393 start_codon:yes stop_codon:yes gene_type:complete
MASMKTVKCSKCANEFQARTADINRGWGKFCSKSCKAKKQTRDTGIAGPDYRAAGKTVAQMRKGGYAKSKFKGRARRTPWDSAGVSKETFLYYAEEYGGMPVFDNRGEYAGLIPEPFDNSQDCQNSDQLD